MRPSSHCQFIILFKHHDNFHFMKEGMGIMKSKGVKILSVGSFHLFLLSDSIFLALYLDAPGFPVS